MNNLKIVSSKINKFTSKLITKGFVRHALDQGYIGYNQAYICPITENWNRFSIMFPWP